MPPRRILWLALAAALLAVAPAGAANLVPNPSAEEGAHQPQGWAAQPPAAGSWTSGGARFGARSLALRAAAEAYWEAALPESVPAAQGYRLSGWVRVEGGSGWIAARLRRHDGRLLTVTTPRSTARAWSYLAVDIPQRLAAQTVPVAVRGVATGGAVRFDGLRLASLDTNILPNVALTPLLVEGKPLPGDPPAGWQAVPATGSLRTVALADQGRALVLSPEAPAVASYLVDLPTGTTACRLETRLKGSGGVACGLSWYGPCGHLRDDFETAAAGTRVLRLWPAPPLANRVQVVFRLGGGGEAQVQPIALVPVLRPAPPAVAVYANQVGYDPGAPHTAIVGTTFFPRRPEHARFSLCDARGRAVWQGPLRSLGRMHEGRPDDWGAYYWLADFTAFRGTGRFTLAAEMDGHKARSHPFTLGPGAVFRGVAELTYRFLYYQRCGGAVPGWHAACHLDDGRLPDGTHANVAGGWHDAGDLNKWMYPNGPPLVLYGLASAYLAHPAAFNAIDRHGNGRSDLLDEVLWGANWLLSMRNPGTGGLYGSVTTGWTYWGQAEKETDGVPGNADDRPIADEKPASMRAAAAFALVARCVRDGGKWLQAAMDMEAACRAEGDGPDRLLACLAIWQAGGSAQHLEWARSIGRALAQGSPQGEGLAALALLMAADPQSGGNPEYRATLARSVGAFARRQSQPFPVSAGRSGRDDGMEQADRVTQWGRHMDLTCNAWAMAACARVLASPAAYRALTNELDWLLGLNPLDLCMVHGAGSHHPARYHHRYASYPGHRDGAVPGAIPNGIGRPSRNLALDLPFMDEENRDPSTDEPWIPYNGFLLCALAQMEAGE